MALVKRLELDAAPTQVWDAVATGPGISSWFNPTELEPRKGGSGRTDFGGGTYSEGTVLIYEPEKRIVIAGERIAHDIGAKPEPLSEQPTLEFRIEDSAEELPPVRAGRSLEDVRSRLGAPQPLRGGVGEVLPPRPSAAGKTVLSFRQDGFPEADQAVYEAGWKVYFHTLNEYLVHFAGKPAFSHVSLAISPLERQEQFARVTGALGLDHTKVAVGARVKVTPKGRTEPIAGVVDLTLNDPHLSAIGIRLPNGFLRCVSDDSCGSALNFYQYVVDPPPDFARQRRTLAAQSRKLAASWQGWLQEQLAA